MRQMQKEMKYPNFEELRFFYNLPKTVKIVIFRQKSTQNLQNRYGSQMAVTLDFDITENQTALPFLSFMIADFPYAQFSLWRLPWENIPLSETAKPSLTEKQN